ncbi:hypothetical protein OG921_15960 [Aldersonia sp. NBC_00410]|uniref:hypothetical protein n=1 Tax=Aldersonia sp. NBC_00410 TaxID=2975954 RepID=UPI00224E6B2E|nr:hypothetical protein [Aldersonia sp. NBC_00410]MCX5044663.1 hypothetical protein [Aldersonia sp. NBC_00410]
MGNAWQITTRCGGQLLFEGLGHTPHPRSVVGPSGGQIVANTASHVWAGIVFGVGTAVKTVQAWFNSDPIDLGAFMVDDNGVAVVDFAVPNVAVGNHHLEVHGDDGSVYSVPIYVTDEPVEEGPVIVSIGGSSMITPPTGGPGDPGGSSGSADMGNIFGR